MLKNKRYNLLLILIPAIFACRALLPTSTKSSPISTPTKGPSVSNEWFTYLDIESDFISDIDHDDLGNIYVASVKVIGATPGEDDDTRHLYLSKLTDKGYIEWSVMVTETLDSGPSPITVDKDGNTYLTGSSKDSWGSPIRPFGSRTLNGYYGRTFVAKVDTQGSIIWNTFLEGTYPSQNIILGQRDSTIYLLNDYGGGPDPDELTLVKINTSGEIQQVIALPGLYEQKTLGLDPQLLKTDSQGNVYIGGHEDDGGGTLNDLSYFIAKTNNSGTVSWKTVLSDSHWGYAQHVMLEVGNDGSSYIVGESNSTWGNPINPYDGGRADLDFPDLDYLNGYTHFIAKVNSDGMLLWHTFLSQYAIVNDTALDENGNLYLVGDSGSSWGAPYSEFAGSVDGFVAVIDQNGSILWSTFVGGTDVDVISAITPIDNQHIYVGGYSYSFLNENRTGQNTNLLFVSLIKINE